MKILITYGTRFGATARSAQVLGEELEKYYGHEVHVLNASKVNKESLDWADKVVIGSSIVLGQWKSSSKHLLKLAKKKSKPVAVFVSAAVTLSEEISTEKLAKDGNGEIADRLQYAIEHFIDPVCNKYRVEPFAKTAFGGKLSILGNVIIDNQSDKPIQEWAKIISEGGRV